MDSHPAGSARGAKSSPKNTPGPHRDMYCRDAMASVNYAEGIFVKIKIKISGQSHDMVTRRVTDTELGDDSLRERYRRTPLFCRDSGGHSSSSAAF